jgi:ribosome-associated protein
VKMSSSEFTDRRIIEIASGCRDVLIEKKGEKISLLDLRKVNSFLDYFIICSGNSRIHGRALAKEVERFFASIPFKSRSISDLSSDWIILDYNEIVVHIFTEEMRAYYDLDRLWSDAEKIL